MVRHAVTGLVVLVLAAQLGAQQSSPFAPPEITDTTFVVDSAPGLDTGCTFRSGGPLIFDVPITRFVGPINGNGNLLDAADLIAAGLISPQATLVMPVFDVDDQAMVTPPNLPEIDKVFVNGMEVGTLSGANNVWKLNSFQIPIDMLKFPHRGANGQAPTPAMNQIRIDIDVGNAPLGDELWCVAVDWAAISFKVISPVVFVHGNNSDGGFFDRQGFTPVLAQMHVPFDNSITMATASVAAHSAILRNLIPPIVTSFGVDSIHIVCHSKGGLDTRDYLAKYQRSMPFDILSVSSLSSPHNGSAGADVLVAYALAAARADEVEFSGFPTFSQTLASTLGTDAGTPNLTTTFTAAFNARNLPALPAGIIFNTVGADADQNATTTIDQLSEYAELVTESAELGNLPGFIAVRVIDVIYQILRGSSGVAVTYARVPGFFYGSSLVATVTSVPNPTPLGNDTLVTIPSAMGQGGLAARVTNTASFTGTAGRNHSSVADGVVAATVIPWIIAAEQLIGDLK